ncbi:hypothetical protein OIU78_012631 [Salix suchowensis]|nr:hypothetical protein OIU78_012631 [Salix suchowensis]
MSVYEHDASGQGRQRSRSVSNSPGSHRGRYRDWSRAGARAPDVGPTPREKRPAISEGLKSRLGPRADDQPFPNKRKTGI